MKLMPFNEAVYRLLLDDGYTHLIVEDEEIVKQQILKGQAVTMEAVRNAVTAAPAVLELSDPAVMQMLHNADISYYIRVKPDSPSGHEAPSARYTKYVVNAIQRQYSHMVGHPFIKDGEHWGNIESVSIAPYDELNKWIFLSRYKEIPCPLKAMEFYQVPYFDVVLIGRNYVNKTELVCVDLSTYLTGHMQANSA